MSPNLLALLFACRPSHEPATPPPGSDGDGDGSPVELDCDDQDPRRHPGAADTDGDDLDANCDGLDGVGTSLAPYLFFDPPEPAYSLEAGYTLLVAQFDEDPAAELVVAAYHYERDEEAYGYGEGAVWVLDGPQGELMASWEGTQAQVLGEYVAVGRFVGDDALDDLVFSTRLDYYLVDGDALATTSAAEATRIPKSIPEDDDAHANPIFGISAGEGMPDLLAAGIWPGADGPEVRFYELEVGVSTHLDDFIVSIEGAVNPAVVNARWVSDERGEIAVGDSDHDRGRGLVRIGQTLADLAERSAALVEIEGENTGDWLGESVSTAPALDGGPGQVLWVGASGFPNNERAGRLYGLRPGQTLETADWTFTGRRDGIHRLGLDHALADLDGDGALDLVVSASGNAFVSFQPAPCAGAVHVFFGPLPPGDYTSDDADLSFVGESLRDGAGIAIEAADVTGDGQVDLVVSAPGRDAEDGTLDVGRVYLVPGPLR